MIVWPDSLVSALAERRTVLFVGAGISAGSRDAHDKHPPLWTGLLRGAAEKCSKVRRRALGLIRHGDYLLASELIRDELKEEWRELLTATFLRNFAANENHSHVFDLGQRVVVTPNFDTIYDQYAKSRSSDLMVKVSRDSNLLADLRSGRSLVLKIHGSIDDPESIVITRSDYARARVQNAGYYRVVDSLFLLNTVVFLGCGLSDPDVQLLLETQAFMYETNHPHYFVTSMRVGEAERDVLRKTRNLKILTYSARSNHKELTMSLAALVDAVETRRKATIAARLSAVAV